MLVNCASPGGPGGCTGYLCTPLAYGPVSVSILVGTLVEPGQVWFNDRAEESTSMGCINFIVVRYLLQGCFMT